MDNKHSTSFNILLSTYITTMPLFSTTERANDFSPKGEQLRSGETANSKG